jgi:hypothetical protein
MSTFVCLFFLSFTHSICFVVPSSISKKGALILSHWSSYSDIAGRMSKAHRLYGCGHYGANATHLEKASWPLMNSSFTGGSISHKLSRLRKDCSVATCMLCFDIPGQVNSEVEGGIRALLFGTYRTYQGHALIRPGIPFENWRVRMLISDVNRQQHASLILELIDRGVEVVSNMWSGLEEYDKWLVRRIDSRLNEDDEGYVADWVASGVPSHVVM